MWRMWSGVECVQTWRAQDQDQARRVLGACTLPEQCARVRVERRMPSGCACPRASEIQYGRHRDAGTAAEHCGDPPDHRGQRTAYIRPRAPREAIRTQEAGSRKQEAGSTLTLSDRNPDRSRHTHTHTHTRAHTDGSDATSVPVNLHLSTCTCQLTHASRGVRAWRGTDMNASECVVWYRHGDARSF